MHGPEWAIDSLGSVACEWTQQWIDFVDRCSMLRPYLEGALI